MYKYHIIFLTVIALLSIGNTEAYAQKDLSHIAFFPAWGDLYYDSDHKNQYGETSNIERFFDELKEWSKLYRNGVEVNEDYNAIFVKHFKEYYSKEKERSKFISLPMDVQVIKYDCDLRDYIHKEYELFANVLPVSITSFTPVIDSDKDVVYISEEAEELLNHFITEPMYETVRKSGRTKIEKDDEKITEADNAELMKRVNMVWEYVPAGVTYTLWGESWHFLSFPQILSLIVGNDGYIINIGQMASYGTTYFVPWGGEPEEIDSWIA